MSQLSKLSILTSDFYSRYLRYASQKYAHIFNIYKDHAIKVTFLSRLSLIMTWANLESVLAINIDCCDRARASTSHFCFRRMKAGVLVPAPDQKPYKKIIQRVKQRNDVNKHEEKNNNDLIQNTQPGNVLSTFGKASETKSSFSRRRL